MLRAPTFQADIEKAGVDGKLPHGVAVVLIH